MKAAGWKSVIYLWIAMLVVSAVCLIISIPMWKRFVERRMKID